MKLSVISVFFSTCIVCANSLYAQDTRISLQLKDATVKEILNEIERVSEFIFIFRNDAVDLDRKITVSVLDKSIEHLMDLLFGSTDNSYEIIDRQVIISKRLKPSTSDAKLQQQTIVTGTITDEKNSPLPGANVLLKGTLTGVVTDAEGRYSINVPNRDAVLVFSFVGFATQEIAVGSRSEWNVHLSEISSEIEEVVVIGYGTVKKRDLTGAVSSVKAGDLNIVSTASVGHVLQGKAAGLSVIQNSAQPGGGLDILIRGAGSVNAGNRPLYIVDGFPIAATSEQSLGNTDRLNSGTQGILNFLNPNDISSIDILKDASATAIYGSRAANGVVLITTKRGTVGKPTVSFSASYALQKHTDIYDVFRLKEWMDEKNVASWDMWMYDNEVYPYGNRTLEEANELPKNGVKYKLPYTDTEIENAGEGTDWIGLVTRDGHIEQYNLSIQGGTPESKYLMSANYYDHHGIIKNSRMKRYTGKINFDQNLSKYFKLALNLAASRLDNDNTPLGDGQWEKSGLIRAAVQMGPHIEAKLPDGSYPINPMLPTQPNPYSLLEVTDNSIIDRIVANSSITAEPVKDLLIKLNVGLDRSIHKRHTYMPKTTLYGGNSNGIATINERGNEQYLTEITASYHLRLKEAHQLAFLAGYSYEQFKTSEDNSGNNNFLTDGFLWNNLNAGEGTKVVGSNAYSNKMASFFGRINYTLLDRYLFTATLRTDGASVFARNHKWGVFPSVALGWNMSEEEFMSFGKDIIHLLKWRISYGQTGNSDIGSNAFASYYPQIAWATHDDGPVVGVFPSRLENPDLKWETTSEFNVGLDVSVFDGRISASFEYYRKVISDLLNFKPLNTYQDISFVMANIGKTQSRGFEITLNTGNFSRQNFSWTSDLTFTTYRDRWLERTDDWKPAVFENVTDPIRANYYRQAVGILQTSDARPAAQQDLRPGQLIIADINGYVRDADDNPAVDASGKFMLTGNPDGIIDDADTRLTGSRDPGFIIGLGNRIKYKGFDLGFHFYGMFQRVMEDPTRMAYGVSSWPIAQYGYNGLRSVRNRWMPDRPSTTHPSSFYSGSRYGNGDFFLEKAWFIRLQTIGLGYTLPENKLLNKLVSSLRVHVDVNNVFVITPYGGLDPETDSYTAAYPNARTYSVGIDIKF
ncbi:MAG: SusC/RagA family TonB-linked outer membrane protein [Bacteroidales bacterium]|jgi:TonB-linked SusC/RagA family outer membrane protein|nr:SusC/RagA family TonB-linked outer membrane protein [Bacteroidales bacterium]